MPRENRKRGKKNKKKTEEFQEPETQPESESHPEVGPSWIVSSTLSEDTSAEAPFGYVDTDVKAYFRTVDTQIRDWQDGEGETLINSENNDPNAERQTFFVAALTEMTGKEKQLATDPDCSIILERMAYSMDDFVRRVFMDSLCGSYEGLFKHRFASHVCQTMITVAAETVSRETAGVLSTVPRDSDRGELRTMTQLILDICNEILPTVSTLVMDPFASHVIRALLALLSPITSSGGSDTSQTNVRSKKSAMWKSRQGQLKSVFDNKGKGKEGHRMKTPPEFSKQARTFVEVLKSELDDNEVRALGADKIASPCLTMLLEIEASHGMSDQPKSLMDRVTMGIVSASLDNETDTVTPSDYLGTLFRDPTSSHLLEIIILRASDKPFGLIWNTYMKGRLARLGIHPVANFVVAKALERANTSQLTDAYEELKDSWEKSINSSRSGVLRAIVDRSISLRSLENRAIEAAFTAFGIKTPEDRKLLVPCALRMQMLLSYRSRLEEKFQKRDDRKDVDIPFNVQGSLLLQSLLKLPEVHNQVVIDSFISLDIDERLAIAHDPTASRILDTLLESTTVSAKSKRAFIMSFIGHFHLLADDRIGSRVCDRIFAFADTYLKEKIGRSLIPHEQALAASYYGKFFSRNLNLYLLRRRPDEWKDLQSSKRSLDQEQAATTTTPATLPIEEKSSSQMSNKKRKREKAIKDEIDEVFDTLPTKKTKNSSLTSVPVKSVQAPIDNDPGLQDVFSAIRSVPKNTDRKKGGSKKKS
ncbi:hypothetical protein K435DRAFT_765540 [Dendrothele bispora CBS 962.96]|uniref:Nucleolar protein 9 n=1 Tax=Dendrothele bispora (strain CBS 962.96) TaxID=1314807 RepID=A0A4S8L716_DENBC|nr:hypothetical protein K435DRAFT_765540 [Dendrothele bispora CBS 962.96]